MTTTVADILRKAKSLIPTPAQWTKGHFARDSFGNIADPHDSKARCYCAMGAVQAATFTIGMHFTSEEDAAEGALETALGTLDDCGLTHGCVPDFNDHPDTTHEQILRLFEVAIAAAEAEPK